MAAVFVVLLLLLLAFQQFSGRNLIPQIFSDNTAGNSSLISDATAALKNPDGTGNFIGHVEAAIASAKANYASGIIDFKLLRQTRSYEDTPPAYAKELDSLNGKTVRIVGFMSPFDDLNNMKNFMLLPTVTGCFFCVPPTRVEVVLIRQKVDQADFIVDAVLVEGTLRLWKKESDDIGHQMFLYIIDQASVSIYDPRR